MDDLVTKQAIRSLSLWLCGDVQPDQCSLQCTYRPQSNSPHIYIPLPANLLFYCTATRNQKREATSHTECIMCCSNISNLKGKAHISFVFFFFSFDIGIHAWGRLRMHTTKKKKVSYLTCHWTGTIVAFPILFHYELSFGINLFWVLPSWFIPMLLCCFLICTSLNNTAFVDIWITHQLIDSYFCLSQAGRFVHLLHSNTWQESRENEGDDI